MLKKLLKLFKKEVNHAEIRLTTDGLDDNFLFDFKNYASSYRSSPGVISSFGFYWQILGAWDKEMLLLSEL